MGRARRRLGRLARSVAGRSAPLYSRLRDRVDVLERRRLQRRVERRLSTTWDRRGALRWALKIGAPAGPEGDVWGDLFFADDLARALRARGHEAYVDRLSVRIRPDDEPDDVVLSLRGMYPATIDPHALSLCWVISHPDWVTAEEMRSCDLVFAASQSWARERSASWGLDIRTLLQATDPRRFAPPDVEARSGIVFVGKTRNVFRPIVKDALEAGLRPQIHGDGWEQFIDPALVTSEFLSNDDVPEAYGSAEVVLNDHWEDMRREGFISNRIFDALATATPVISDRIDGVEALFNGAVRTYANAEELRTLAVDGRWPGADAMLAIADMIARDHSFDARAADLEAAVLRSIGRR